MNVFTVKEHKCKFCNKPVYYKQAGKTNVYCSIECLIAVGLYVEKTCVICNCKFNVDARRADSAKTCSVVCRGRLSSISLMTQISIPCEICTNEFKIKPSRLLRKRSIAKSFCYSKSCDAIRRSNYLSVGANNSMFGRTGENSPHSYVNKLELPDRINSYGYRLTFDYRNSYYLREHILVVETDLSFNDKFFFINANGHRTLNSKVYVVHHIDFDKLNNYPSNLLIMTRREHTALHNALNPQPRGIDNKFISRKLIGVIKLGELLENPEEDNQQLS